MPNSLPPDYRPSDGEEFMNPRQLEYFRQKLLRWRSELLEESSETLIHLKEESLSEPDITDRASLETERSLELRTRDRERKLIAKIDAALERIQDGTYGYCEETDEPISLRDLLDLLIEVAGRGSYRLVPFPPEKKAIDIGSFYADSTKFKRTTGWEAAVALGDGLSRTIAFYRQHLGRYLDSDQDVERVERV